MDVRPVPLTEQAVRDLNASVERDGHDWLTICELLQKRVAQVWRIGEQAHVLTVACEGGIIEVWACGPDGGDAKACIGHWERAMRACEAHEGRTLVIDGRRGWKRLLRHWDCTDHDDGTVTLTLGIE